MARPLPVDSLGCPRPNSGHDPCSAGGRIGAPSSRPQTWSSDDPLDRCRPRCIRTALLRCQGRRSEEDRGQGRDDREEGEEGGQEGRKGLEEGREDREEGREVREVKIRAPTGERIKESCLCLRAEAHWPLSRRAGASPFCGANLLGFYGTRLALRINGFPG